MSSQYWDPLPALVQGKRHRTTFVSIYILCMRQMCGVLALIIYFNEDEYSHLLNEFVLPKHALNFLQFTETSPSWADAENVLFPKSLHSIDSAHSESCRQCWRDCCCNHIQGSDHCFEHWESLYLQVHDCVYEPKKCWIEMYIHVSSTSLNVSLEWLTNYWENENKLDGICIELDVNRLGEENRPNYATFCSWKT